MAYKVVSAGVEQLSLVEAKLHLRVDVTDDDTLITALITAAREFAEHYTGLALSVQTLEMSLNGFPSDNDSCIELDMPPVASITSVKYTDVAGVEQTISSAAYVLSLYGDSRRLSPANGYYWPSTQDVSDSVRIRYIAGYAAIPKAVKAALLLLVGHLYANRENSSTFKVEEIPLGARSLLDTVKVWSK